MAKKRFHQSMRDRMHEMRGMHAYEDRMKEGRGMGMMKYMEEMAEGRGMYRHGRDYHNDEFRHDMGDERSRGIATGGYLTEDRSQIANLPQNVKYHPYGDPVDRLPQGIDDTITGIDRQRMYDYSKARDHFYPKKV